MADLSGHLCADASLKEEHHPAPTAAFWDDLQYLSMVLLEPEIRSTRQELPGFLNSGISKTFTNARHVSHPPYTS